MTGALFLGCCFLALVFFVLGVAACCIVSGRISKKEEEEKFQLMVNLKDGSVDTLSEDEEEYYINDGSGD